MKLSAILFIENYCLSYGKMFTAKAMDIEKWKRIG